MVNILLFLFAFLMQNSFVSADEQSDKENRLAWFKDAKFGMFIHFGVYSMLGGEYKGQQVPFGQESEWVMKSFKIPVTEYREIAHQFNPVNFDAKAIVSLAKSTGMKYIAMTAKHHDGFAMYHSKVTDYNIYDWTQFKRDPLAELAQACKDAGITFCFYYSHREDWDHPGGYGNGWDYDNDWKGDFYVPERFEKYLDEKAKPQMHELLTNYGPVGMLWFDRGIYTPEMGRYFVDLVHSLQPGAVVNSRVGNYGQELLGDYQSLGDNGMPIGGIEEYWETPQTLNDSCGYRSFDDHWKKPDDVIIRLVEIVSRGGNYLLNIGPKGDGSVPNVTVDILTQVGKWMERNSESIYGTTSNPFPNPEWGYCSVKGSKLYLFVRYWPSDGILKISGLHNKIVSSNFLIDKSRKLKVSQNGTNAGISLPPKPIDSPLTVIIAELDGEPVVDPPVVEQDKNSALELSYLTAVTSGKAVKRYSVKGKFHISKWTAPEDSVTWHFIVATPGTFKAAITYSANKDWDGTKYIISSGGNLIETSVKETGGWYEYKTFDAGTLKFERPGDYTLTIKPERAGEKYLMYFKEMKLEPVKES